MKPPTSWLDPAAIRLRYSSTVIRGKLMPKPYPIHSSTAAKDAAWLEWSGKTHSVGLSPEHPAFRPFHDLGLRILGQDRLHERFHAGTPCSSTHLLWMVTSGSIRVDYGQGPMLVEKGDMVLAPALRPHWVSLASKSARGLWFHFHRLPRWQHLSKSGPGIHRSRNAADMEWLLERCIRECSSDEFGAGRNALDHARVLAVLLERELSAFGSRPREIAVVKRLEKLWQEIIGHPERHWTVASLAARAGTSSRELHRLCASLYGIGPMGLVTRMRMDRAMELLLNSDRKIEDIAGQVGYKTAHAFSEAFLSHVGKRPGSFRTGSTPS